MYTYMFYTCIRMFLYRETVCIQVYYSIIHYIFIYLNQKYIY